MVRNHHPYTPALGCEAQLDAWCEKNCPHSDDHSPLRARLDASSVDAGAAWRCYAPSTLSDDGQRYVRGSTYCTRDSLLRRELDRCRERHAAMPGTGPPTLKAPAPPPSPPPPPSLPPPLRLGQRLPSPSAPRSSDLSIGSVSDGVLLYDYVAWEQLSKQRRGIMWALQTARSMKRALVLPSLRFHTAQKHVYEYLPYGALFEIDELRKVHPVVDLADVLAAADAPPPFSELFQLQRGVPKDVPKDDNSDWVDGDCVLSGSGAEVCEMGEASGGDGEVACHRTLAFGGAPAVRFANVSCGWAPTMNWGGLLRSRKALPSVAIQNVVYQLPPVALPRLADEVLRARVAESGVRGGTYVPPPCGWAGCAYEHMRRHMVPKAELVDEARAFLLELRLAAWERHQEAARRRRRIDAAAAGIALDDDDADLPHAVEHHAQRALPRVLAVHWRRGDFVAAKSGQKQKVCTDELTATPLPNGCEWHTIIRTPDELAAVIRKRMGEYNATELFLATNANDAEVAALHKAVGVAPLRYTTAAGSPFDGAPARAMVDTLVAALSDAFVGTRSSMFSWNIFEERVVRGHPVASNSYMDG